MFDLKIGDFGHLFVLISFVSSLIAAFAYFKSTQLQEAPDSTEFNSWKRFARIAFYIHGVSVFGIVYCLFNIIYNHRYEYFYAYDHSSNELPVHYMISCFWEGQEGSFLLWIFWHVLMGLILIKVNKKWEYSLMAIFCLVQAFLVSMILGVVLPGIELKLGSSPFVLFKDQMAHLPVFKLRPDFVPKNGEGLNALLQNYWMVIHPPTLFLGFASTLVPFAYCIAGLWKKQYQEWIRPALPWALFSAMILGTGILMGGYWAYETLNFGGYWNWDPVENAVYVPWLILVASIHTMIAHKNSGAFLKASMILVIAVFILILYSTFLTRSGILGNSSIHSFTDLGMSGQLLVYLLTFTLIAVAILVFRWKAIPSNKDEASVYSREFWIFIGTLVLCLAAFQVIATTSIPVWNSIVKAFGGTSNLAPPVKQEIHYSNWQIWFAMCIAILSGIGQFFWWQKMDSKKLINAIWIPLILTLLISSLVILLEDKFQWYFDREHPLSRFNKAKYILLLTTSLFSIFCNITILASFVRKNPKLSGGSISHLGIAMMLIGILYSSGYSKVISLNLQGLLLSKDAPPDYNRDNVLLWRSEPEKMNEFEVTYRGPRVAVKGVPGYIDRDLVIGVDNGYKGLARKDLFYEGKRYFSKGDTVGLDPENVYYEVFFRKDNGDTFKLFPRLQFNPQMGTIASPDIQRFLTKDLYSHLSNIPVNDEERKWSETEEVKVKLGDTLFLNDFIGVVEKVEKIDTVPELEYAPDAIAVGARIKIFGKAGKVYHTEPILAVRMNEGTVSRVPDMIRDLGVMISFLNFEPETHTCTLGINTTQKEFIVLKAIEKPMINVLWVGTLLLVIGMIIAIVRRYSEFVKMREKSN